MSVFDRMAGHLKARIAEEYAAANAASGRAKVLEGVLDKLEAIAAESPTPDAAPAAASQRAPRRDIKGTVLQAVRDYMEAKGLGPRLEDVQIGAGILLGSDLTESTTRRALDALIANGQMRLHDNRYATGGFTDHLASAAK